MSLPESRTIKCPKCGKELNVTVWESINTNVPNAAEDIISGKLFEKECDSCGYKINLVYPILYNDMVNHAMIYFVPKEKVDETVEQTKTVVSGGKYRVVGSQVELREKAKIFSEGLDDRIVELYKVFAGAEIEAQLSGRRIKDMYFNVMNGEYKLAVSTLSNESFLFDINRDSIKAMEEDPTVMNLLKNSEGDCVIDSKWVGRMMTQKVFGDDN